MGSVFRQKYTALNAKTGKREVRESKKWYIQYHNGIAWKREAAYTDKAASLAKLVRREKEVARETEGIFDHFSAHLVRPIAEHIAEYKSHLKNKGNTKLHCDTTAQRVEWICTAGKVETISSITASRIDAALSQLSAVRSKNHYLRAIKMFSKWLVDERRARENAIAGMRKKTIDDEGKKERRPLTAVEFAKLLVAAEKGPPLCGVAGRDRVALYLLAAFTGFRRNELAAIVPESFQLSDQPRVDLPSRQSKRRRSERLPLKAEIADYFGRWLAGKPAGVPLWRIAKEKTAEMIQADLTAAGVVFREGDVVIEFHSLRQTFITGMARAGVAPKVAQQLARHSTIDLTMNTYAKLTSADEREAVGMLTAPDYLTHNLTQTAGFDCPILSTTDHEKTRTSPASDCQRKSRNLVRLGRKRRTPGKSGRSY